MYKFKVGDKVKVKGGLLSGKIGRIAFIRTIKPFASGFPYVVLFDEDIDIFTADNPLAIEVTQKGYDYRKIWIYDDDELELVEEEKKMENVKSLLKSGDIVVFGDDRKAKVFLDYQTEYYGKGALAYTDEDSFMSLSSYDDDLFTSSKNEHYGINKIYRPKSDCYLMNTNLSNYNLIWERKEVKEMTMEEICKALGYDVKIKKEDK